MKVEDGHGKFVKNFDRILSVKIRQQEGFLPFAQLCVPKDANVEDWISHEYTYSLIEQTPQRSRVLLKGRCVGQMPKGLHALTIALMPNRPSEEEILPLLEPYVQDLDELFTHTDDSGFNYPIETEPVIVDFDRFEHGFAMNNVLEGRRGIILNDLPTQWGFHVDVTKTAYGGVRLKMEVSWSRACLELLDLGQLIQQGVGPIHTLTPRSMQEAWPKSGQPLCRGIFTVISSSLPIADQEEVFVPKVDSKTGGHERVPVSIAKMNPQLIVSYEKNFLYHEIFETEVRLSDHSSLGPVVRHNLKLNASSEETHVQDKSFLESHRGKKAIQYAMKMAQVKLLASHRNRRLTLTVPYDKAWKISTFDWVVVEDPRLISGKFEGKVSSYTIHIEGSERLVTVSLSACSSHALSESVFESRRRFEDLSVVLKESDESQDDIKNVLADVSIDHEAQSQIGEAEQDLKVNATLVTLRFASQAFARNQTIRSRFVLE